MKRLIVVIFLLLFSTARSACGDIVVNVDAQVNGSPGILGDGADVELFLTKGMYRFTLVNNIPSHAYFHPDALFTAWDGHAGGPPPWGTNYQFNWDDGDASNDTRNAPPYAGPDEIIGGRGPTAPDPESAFNDAVAGGRVSMDMYIPFDQTVGFYFADPQLSDNLGGVSVLVSQIAVPEPGSLGAVSLLAIGGLLYRRRRRRNAKPTGGRSRRNHRSSMPAIIAVCGLAAALGTTTAAHAQGRTDTIAKTGDAAPDGNGTISSLNDPVLNDAGQAAFSASLTGTSGGTLDDTGIFRGSGGAITQIAREGQAAPDGNGTFLSFQDPVLNAAGQAAFRAILTGTSGGNSDDLGIFRGGGGVITQIAREGQAAPDGNGSFSIFLDPVLNDSGQAAFFAFLTGTSGGTSDNNGIFRGSGGAITQIARTGQAAPDGNGTFDGLNNPTLNDSGQAAFFAGLTGTSGGTLDDTGIFRGSGGAITQIAREGQAAPDGNGTFSSFNTPVLNAVGQAAFRAFLTGTSGGSSDELGIFRGSGGVITQIARAGQAAPDGNGTYSIFSDPALNDSGQAAFFATLTGTTGGSSDDSGIFRGSGGAITQIAREGQATPDGNGTFLAFGHPELNNSGQAALSAALTGTSGGASNDSGIFTGDGIDFFQVVREGDSLSGSTITSLSVSNGALNKFGQIVYQADLANGNQVISRWTPDLHWRATFSGGWDISSRWTLGLTPAFVHDVFIDPASSLTVSGPSSDTTVRSLQVGGGSGLATLDLQNGATLTATSGVTIQSTGTLTGDGTIAGIVTNNGTVIAENITATNLINNRIIEGNGRIHTSLFNNPSGEIRANNGDSMWLSGPALTNSGLVEVHGGELRVSGSINNVASRGLISVRDGSFIAETGMTNNGSLAATNGTSTIRGDINNTATGIIQVSGGAHATFFDDLTQNGTMQVSKVGNTNSTAVVLGAFTGSGGFVGGGDLFALGDLRPGNSPASVLMDGNLFLGAATDTFVELGGLNPGEFDQLLVTGDFNLAGDLLVSLINGHTLGFNQEYLIADVGGLLTGQFNGLGEGALVGNFGGMDLFITYGAGDGNDIGLFTAVPEPGTMGCIALLAGFGLMRRRRSEIG